MNGDITLENNIIRKVSVIGLGYVGLPLALLLVEKGFEVVGIDIDHRKIDLITQGISYLTDIENQEIRNALTTNRFTATDQYTRIKCTDYIVICVPTPLTPHHTPDLSYLQQVGRSLGQHMQTGQVVILESSTYPGTTREVLLPLLEKGGMKVGSDIFLAYSPERIDPGNTAFSLCEIPKVLSGVTEVCTAKAKQLYSQVFSNLVTVSTIETAELTKLVENCHRFINISFMNELATLCETMNIDVWEVIDAAKTKPYGFTAFYPGPGIGGHCIPVDPLYLSWKVKQFGLKCHFIELSNQINQKMPIYLVDRVKEYLSPKKVKDSNILIYGIAYKRDINDVRESRALDTMKLLLKEGANVKYHDPFNPVIKIGNELFNNVDLTEKELKDSDLVILLTDHSNAPVQFILDHSCIVFDTRNMTKGHNGNAKVFRLGGGYR